MSDKLVPRYRDYLGFAAGNTVYNLVLQDSDGATIEVDKAAFVDSEECLVWVEETGKRCGVPFDCVTYFEYTLKP